MASSLNLQTEQTTSQSAFDRLIQLLREPNRMAGATITGRNNGNEKRTLQETVKNLTGEKKEQEFTDQLWNLLIGKPFCYIFILFRFVFKFFFFFNYT